MMLKRAEAVGRAFIDALTPWKPGLRSYRSARSPADNPSWVLDVLGALDIAVLVEERDGSLRPVDAVPDWLASLCTQADADGGPVEATDPFLENFLIEARAFWQGEHAGHLRSGPWVETDDQGHEQAFEASAMCLDGRHVLLVELANKSYREKQRLQQVAYDARLANEHLQRLAFKDELTGLYNRRGFLALAQEQWLLAKRHHDPLLLFAMDLCSIKTINDAQSLNIRGRALVEFAQILRDVFRETDVIGRLGGDEYAALVVNASQTAERRLMDRLQTVQVSRNARAGRVYQLAFSIGVAAYDGSRETTLNDLLSRADARMYRHKCRPREN